MTDNSGYSALAFRPVDLNEHVDVCIRFGIDAHICSVGSAERFHGVDGKGAERYVKWLRQKAAALPGCVVHVWLGDTIIGQIEMGRVPSDATVGYVNLFYLISEFRGHGLGALLEAYAWKYLGALGCQSIRLSASKTNTPAWLFYQRNGWQDLGPREDDPAVNLLHKHANAEVLETTHVINPDDYLETEFGREFTPERNRQAWAQAYARLASELSEAPTGAHLYVVMGVQGAGKSRWVSDNIGRLGPRAIVFDAALPARRHREKLLLIARDHGVPAIAIFVQASLEQALARNARRASDKRVPDAALRSVFSLLEPPVEAEGFIWVETAGQTKPLPTALQTPRLSLVTADISLAEPLAVALNASYELHREFLSWSKPHWTLADTQQSLQRAHEDFSMSAREKKYFLLSRSDEVELVGCIGLTPQVEDDSGFEVGYWVHQAHAGRGFMKEALGALMAQLTEQPLFLTTSSANIASQRLAQSVGFQCVQTIQGARQSETFGICDTLVYQRPV
jgi:RimJ/RimL family protein N-acetyltransferase